MPVDLRIPALWRRLVALLINLISGMVLGIGAIAAGFGAQEVYERVRGHREPAGPETGKPLGHFELSAAQRIAMWVLSGSLGVLGRNQPGPAFRLLRLRRVDARTGGPVSVRSALVGEVFDLALRAVTNPLLRSRTRRVQERLAELSPGMKEIERKHADDPQARQLALMEFYESNRVNPFASCAWCLVPGMLSTLLLALWSPRGRSIRDRVTRTVVVVGP